LNPSPYANAVQGKWEQLLHPSHELCRADVIWVLEYIKKKVAEENPALLGLSQPRLLTSFRCYAEIAMMLIYRHNAFDQDQARLKELLREAAYGLLPGSVPAETSNDGDPAN
jgi:hypothetical protein